jgi:glycine cleavage system H lipoate-binding protein
MSDKPSTADVEGVEIVPGMRGTVAGEVVVVNGEFIGFRPHNVPAGNQGWFVTLPAKSFKALPKEQQPASE